MTAAYRPPNDVSPTAIARAVSPRGALYSFAAYAIWGLFPLYFRALKSVAPLEIMIHRVVWSVLFLGVVLTFKRHWGWLGEVRRNGRVLRTFAASATFLSVNWFIYIWAVAKGRVVDASLGYFINPLVNVLLGVALLGERLRRAQIATIALAAVGVAWLAARTGELPWIGLALGATFGIYGFFRKTAALGALEGLALETALLFPFAAGYLVWIGAHGESRLLDGGAWVQMLLVLAGPITAIPLLLFAAGARRIPMTLMGFLQYVTPTLQLLVGVLLFGEPFAGAKLVGFALIWLALALYTAEGLWFARSASRRARFA